MVTHSPILEHVIDPTLGNLAPEVARYLLTLNFPPADLARFAVLSEKAQLGTLTEQEAADLDDFLDADAFLTIVRMKAQSSLKNHSSAA